MYEISVVCFSYLDAQLGYYYVVLVNNTWVLKFWLYQTLTVQEMCWCKHSLNIICLLIEVFFHNVVYMLSISSVKLRENKSENCVLFLEWSLVIKTWQHSVERWILQSSCLSVLLWTKTSNLVLKQLFRRFWLYFLDILFYLIQVQ